MTCLREMTPLKNPILLFAAFIAAVMLQADPAFAYIGPGAGLSAIGSLFTLIGAVFLAIVGFIWYPVKRLLRNRKRTAATAKQPAREDGTRTS